VTVDVSQSFNVLSQSVRVKEGIELGSGRVERLGQMTPGHLSLGSGVIQPSKDSSKSGSVSDYRTIGAGPNCAEVRRS
jgi:hypothetical protein